MSVIKKSKCISHKHSQRETVAAADRQTGRQTTRCTLKQTADKREASVLVQKKIQKVCPMGDNRLREEKERGERADEQGVMNGKCVDSRQLKSQH